MLPIFHGIGKLGWQRACTEIGAQWYLAEGACAILWSLPFRGKASRTTLPWLI